MATKKNNASKIFIVDTNVLLHDHQCIYNFQENDVIIPIVVLEELDKFKKGSDQINFQAREFVRQLDQLAGEKLFTEGVSLGPDKGRLFIATGKNFPQIMNDSFSEKTPDHRILAIALHVKDHFPERTTIFISKDINLRMKAKSLGLTSADYESDKVKNIDFLHKGVETFDNFDLSAIERLYKSGSVLLSDFPMNLEETMANQYFILRNTNQSVLAWYDPFAKAVRRVEKAGRFWHRTPKCRTNFLPERVAQPRNKAGFPHG
jgi:PhoH-like ATPase